MSRDAFFEKVHALGSIADADFEMIVAAVLLTLGERLTRDEVAILAGQVPEAIIHWLRPGTRAGAVDLDEVYARVAQRAGLRRPRAMEATQIVCRALTEDLADDARARLVAHLGPALGRLFEAPGGSMPSVRLERPARPARAPRPGEGHTLVNGRPGSRHPLSEARPERAQAESVVRSDNPHGDSKLSSARGVTQEVLHETLAEGKAGPLRTVADTED